MTGEPNPMRQYLTMMAVCTALMFVGVGFAIAHFIYGVAWALWAFLGFVAAGFVAQILFVRAFARSQKGK